MSKGLTNKQIMIGLLIASIVLLTILKGGFLASFTMICDNDEPSTLSAWNNYSTYYNQSFVQQADKEFIIMNETSVYSYYKAFVNNDEINVYDTSGGGCSIFIDEMEATANNTNTLTFEGLRVVVNQDDQQFYWCPRSGNLALSVTGLDVLNRYNTEFISCEEVEEVSHTNVTSSGAPIIDDTGFPEEEIIIEDDTPLDNKTLTILLVMAALLVYFVYEAGPNKGVFRGKK